MNDAEIIKALEYCINSTICLENCEKCPYKEQSNYCVDEMLKDCLNLIKHQQAENEKLKLENTAETGGADNV
jgi:hypothetical protein